MRFISRITIKWRLIGGFFVCVLFTGLSGGLGIFFMQALQNKINASSGEISGNIEAQNRDIKRLTGIRTCISAILGADAVETLNKISLPMEDQPGQSHGESRGGRSGLPAAVKNLHAIKSGQLTTAAKLVELRKAGGALLDEVVKLALTIVDNADFEAAVSIDEAGSEIKKNLEKIIASKTLSETSDQTALNQRLDTMAAVSGKALGTIKTALSVRADMHKLEALVKDVLINDDMAAVDYSKIEITTLTERIKSATAVLPADEMTAQMGKLMSDLSGLIDQMVRVKKDAILAGRQLRETNELIEQSIIAVNADMLEASQRLKTNSGETMKACTDLVTRGRSIQLVLVVIAFLLAALVGWAVTVSITRPIFAIVEFAGRLRLGDLSVRIDSGHDEIGLMSASLNSLVESLTTKADVAVSISKGDLTQAVQVVSDKDALGLALQVMLKNLNGIIGELSLAARQVDAGSGQVADSSQALSQGATEQASSLEEISSSLNEVGAQTHSSAENAVQANQLSTAARDAAHDGVQRMEEMMSAMGAIQTSSQEIAKIIKTIDGIAFQTNLLALNAAVEAARAGKHGKGFAVVAQEVRSLAARSAKAAQETTALIESAGRRVGEGSLIAQKTSAALGNIYDGITRVADIVGEIAAASNEQAQSITQINAGLGQIDNVTQRNTAIAEETSAAATQLTSQANYVQKVLARFRIRTEAAAPATLKRIEYHRGNLSQNGLS